MGVDVKFDIKELKSLQKKMLSDRGVAAKEIESVVATRYCATGDYFSLTPFALERMKLAKGKLIACAAAPKEFITYEFDSLGKMLSVRRFDKSGNLAFENIVTHDGDRGVSRCYFNYDRMKPADIGFIYYENLKIVESVILSPNGNVIHEKFTYLQSGDIDTIIVRDWDADVRQWETYSYLFTYNPLGEGKASIEVDGKQTLAFAFSKAKQGADIDQKNDTTRRTTLRKLVRAFVAELAEAIHQVALKVKMKGPAFCIAINYSNIPARGCIPEVGIGEAQGPYECTLSASSILEIDQELLNPADFRLFGVPGLRLKGKRLLKLDQELQQLAREGEEVDCRAIAISTSKQLNSMDWSKMDTAKSFIVYPVDDDLADLESNLRKIL